VQSGGILAAGTVLLTSREALALQSSARLDIDLSTFTPWPGTTPIYVNTKDRVMTILGLLFQSSLIVDGAGPPVTVGNNNLDSGRCRHGRGCRRA
jgi:hypothetical protein